ncbi:hypothetical protein [Frigoribacterium sp. PvP032]|uniref:hypothetical protein n=1 Tax=Frigoribacterium sp. PvP032 TaxID=2806589 RepID=UPI001AEB0C47|nr:hypothetical protein [Frigoribacterium sp. PvP032]MBP1189210.1 hypothetical protein [Frigoribacterium sp. PvP032]
MSLTKISTVVGGALVLGGAAVAGLSMSAQAAEAPATSATSATSAASTQAQVSSTTSAGTAANEVTTALDAAAVQEYGTPARESLAYLAAADPANDLYLRCIADRTGPAATTSTGTATTETTDSSSLTRPATAAETAVGEQAEAFCAPLEPAPPWELDRSNPEAATFAADVVDRLEAAGVTEVAVAPDDGGDRVGIEFGGAANDASSISKGMELLPSIALEVARG